MNIYHSLPFCHMNVCIKNLCIGCIINRGCLQKQALAPPVFGGPGGVCEDTLW